MSEEEWIDECASLLTVEPFNWPEMKARDMPQGCSRSLVSNLTQRQHLMKTGNTGIARNPRERDD
jgi:hypothetical protein